MCRVLNVLYVWFIQHNMNSFKSDSSFYAEYSTPVILKDSFLSPEPRYDLETCKKYKLSCITPYLQKQKFWGWALITLRLVYILKTGKGLVTRLSLEFQNLWSLWYSLNLQIFSIAPIQSYCAVICGNHWSIIYCFLSQNRANSEYTR